MTDDGIPTDPDERDAAHLEVAGASAEATTRRRPVLRISSDGADAATPVAPRSRRGVVSAAAGRPRNTLAVALLGLAVLVGGAAVLTPTATVAETAPRPEPVASTELVCPVTTATAALTSTVVAGVAPLESVTTGVATLANLATKSEASAPPLVIREPGASVARVISGKPGRALLGRATGSFAQGFGADQTIRSGQGATRGLAAAPCARPVTDAWLVGGGSTVGRLTQVLLVNDDDRAAQVDLLLYGAGGQLSSPAGQGIVLAPGSRRQVRLDALAPNQPYLAVHVVARSGRIGVLGLDQQAIGLVPLGMALIPASEASTRLVVPAVPEPVRVAILTLLSPDVDTTVDLTLLTPDGPVVPTGISTVTLPAGRIVAVRVEPALAGVTSGLLLRSDTPVVAGVEVGTGSTGMLREHDATGPGPALTAPGIVVGLAGLPLRHTVNLSAPDAAATVRLDLYVPGATAATWSRTVTVAAGSVGSVAIPVTTPTAQSMLVVTPLGGGPVYASRTVTEAGARGPMIALAPIYPQRATTLVPAVVSQPGSSVAGMSHR